VAAVLVAPLAGAAVFSGMNVNGEAVDGGKLMEGNVDRSVLMDVSLRNAAVTESVIHRAGVWDSTLDEVQVSHANIRGSTLSNARVMDSTLRESTIGEDVTLCRVGGDHDFGRCTLVSSSGEAVARIEKDAPATVRPNSTFDVRLDLEHAASALTVDVAPSFLPVANPTLNITDVFDVTARNAIAGVEVYHDGGWMANGSAGSAIDLGRSMTGDVTLRIHVASAVIDTSMLRLRVDTGNGAVTFAPTKVEVVATKLAILPQDQQPFGPFVADSLGRLVAMSATDEHGNADRDIDVALRERVVRYAGPEHLDGSQSASVHGDAEFLGDRPIKYSREMSAAAHHPLTLEFATRQVNKLPLAFGDLPVHATHVVAMGPYETDLELKSHATNADGERLEAAPVVFTFAAAAETQTVATTMFGEFDIPGRGQIRVDFEDEREGGSVRFHETPESHDVFVTRHFTDEDDVHMLLASTVQAGLPFGNFVPSAYAVHVDGERASVSGAEKDDLVNVTPGQTTVVHHH